MTSLVTQVFFLMKYNNLRWSLVCTRNVEAYTNGAFLISKSLGKHLHVCIRNWQQCYNYAK